MIKIDEIKDIIDKLPKGKNAKYAVLLCIGIMILILSSTFMGEPKENYNSDLEQRLTQILKQIDGIGDVTVMISGKKNEAEGVIIVAQGAENPAVKQTIYSAAIAALDVKPHKVEVFSKKRGEKK